MKKYLQKISFKKSFAAATIIAFTVTFFLELFAEDQFDILTSDWIASIFANFLLSYIIIFLFFYIILFLQHRCSSCGTRWCYNKTETICINDEYKQFAIIFIPFIIRTNEVIETYACENCIYSDDTKKVMYGLIKRKMGKI